ncbi:hypothetical protein RB195_023441 [Necator americanus]|uniref:Uncharacterized protein n=1 Tax=Necator americanus TaxID=51031 RepID=A0ABR1EJE8_NECAM
MPLTPEAAHSSLDLLVFALLMRIFTIQNPIQTRISTFPYHGSDEGDDAKTLAVINFVNNLGCYQIDCRQVAISMPRFKESRTFALLVSS